MELIPIKELLEDNRRFTSDPDCQESIYMSVGFYKIVGFEPPWICYYASMDGQLVGSAAFKGKPVNGKVEIAYGTFPRYHQAGIGSMICQTLVQLAIATDPGIVVTARTLPEENYSTRILRGNRFKLLGTVYDKDDGDVWEWQYEP